MTNRNTPGTIVVTARRWRDSNGNTYFSAEAALGDKGGKNLHLDVVAIEFRYGYGDHYLEAIFSLLEESGLVPVRPRYRSGGKQAPSVWCREQGIDLDYSAVDVKRKRDL